MKKNISNGSQFVSARSPKVLTNAVSRCRKLKLLMLVVDSTGKCPQRGRFHDAVSEKTFFSGLHI